MSPEQLGSRYLLDERIGEGGLGVVWRGRDIMDGTACAIKLLRPERANDPGILTRFVRERTALLRFRHPNVVTLRDMVVEGDRLALVMDYVAGGDLADYRERRGGTLPAAEALELTAQICSALAASHAAGIVHRDLKPANVLLDLGPGGAQGRVPQARLTDFGIARISGESSVTTAGFIVGTLGYLAPEVISGGEPTPACDVYAAGVTLYEVLAGHPPFTGQAPAVMYAHLNTEPPRADGIPDEAWRLIAACMDKDPARRPSAADLQAALRRAARGTGHPMTAVSDWRPPAEPLPRPGALSATAVLPAVGQAPPVAAARARRPGSRRLAWTASAAAVLLVALGVTFAVNHLTASATPGAPPAPPASSAGTETTPSSASGGAASTSPAQAAGTSPANTKWNCATAPARVAVTQQATGQELQACIRVKDGQLELRGVLSAVPAGRDEQIMLVLENAAQHSGGARLSPRCTAGPCTFTVLVTPPAGGQWAVVPRWERFGIVQSTGDESGFVTF